MYLVIGGSGFLGRYCIKNILEKTPDEVVATYSKVAPAFVHPRVEWVQADVRNFGEIDNLNQVIAPGTKVIYLAAYHHPDRVEENPVLAWDINITALSYAVNHLQDISCFYYASTDTVYGEGSKDKPFTEDSPLLPVNRYGLHKVLAEQITLAHEFNVVRFPFIFGPSLVENRPHFFDKIKQALAEGRSVEMFEDSFRSTLSFNQCAGFLIDLIERYGACDEQVINIAADKPMSKYDAAVALADKFGLDKSLIKPISIKNTNAIFTAKRAETAVLDNSKLKKLLNVKEISLEL